MDWNWKREQEELWHQGAAIEVRGKLKDASYETKMGEWKEQIEIAVDEAVEPGEGEFIIKASLSKQNKDLDPETIRAAIAQIEDPLYLKVKERFGLMDLQDALVEMHFPTDKKALGSARTRLVFDEFFYLQLHLLKLKAAIKGQQRPVLQAKGKLLNQFYRLLPFKLTGAQQRVVSEIVADMATGEPVRNPIAKARGLFCKPS